MLQLSKYSDTIGALGTLACVAIWLAMWALALDEMGRASDQYPVIVTVAYMISIMIAGYGGLVGFWLLAAHGSYLRLGHRVRWCHGNHWAYEERGSGLLHYVREIQGAGYPVPCTIHLSNEDLPKWAQGRREELLNRIAVLHGSDRSPKVKIE